MIKEKLSAGEKPNRLIHEKSPYLLQHAFNPVDWYPWGEEALAKARSENKIIFLSIGYSTCYWCHVMEREVFENDSLAALMNKTVVSIKVDREERPDVDRVYMSALQAMTGSGGWPMSMFLTPDLKPFYGGTYIPAEQRHGRAGFGDILACIQGAWTSDQKQILDAGENIAAYLRQVSNPKTKSVETTQAMLTKGFDAFAASYDPVNAGFTPAPKFPRPAIFHFLLRFYKRTGDKNALEMSLATLQRMAKSGMYDHIGGGFHRYATDERWHLPHFEKMLYDQAQLVIAYLEAYQITRDEFYANVARDVLHYVQRVMSHSEGGFYSAEDAESAPDANFPNKKEEGAFYVWKHDEIEQFLTPEEAAIFNRRYGIEKNGNVIADPHQVFTGKNILSIETSIEEIVKQLNLSTEIVAQSFASAKKKIFDARERRLHSHLDDKILVSWNGLMISAFARASQVLGEEKYLRAADRTAYFIFTHLYTPATQQFLRRYRDGEARIEAHLEDYAMFIQGLLDLYESSFNIEHLKSALTLTERQNQLFYDNEHGGFFDITGDDPSILIRTKEWYDGAEPTGNAIAIMNLLRLAQMTNSESYAAMASKSLRSFGAQLLNAPQAAPQMLVALDFSLSKPKQIIIAGTSSDAHTKALMQEVHSHFIPHKIILLADGAEGQATLASYAPFLENVIAVGGKSTAYICENYTCQLPTSDLKTVIDLLR